MVIMYMGQQHSVNSAERLVQHLLAEVWPAINQQTAVCTFNHCRTPHPAVFRVIAAADLAFASYHRNSVRRTRAKKYQFYLHDSLYKIHLRVYIYTKFLLHITANGITERNNVDTLCTAFIYQDKSLL